MKNPKTKKTSNIREDIAKAKFLKSNLNKLVKDLSSEEYHGMIGTWSSSQFKDILDDEELFIKKYIKKEVPRVEREAFDTGTYFHTGVLEPHKISTEISVYQGKVRRGAEWDKFKVKSKGKMVISMAQKEQGDMMIRAVQASEVAKAYIDGEPEVSLFVRLAVWKGAIYAPDFKKVLSPSGWVSYDGKVIGAFEFYVKVRADSLGMHYISDLKSTSGNPKSAYSVRGTVSKYMYDLSAALYLDMFSLVRPTVREFIWIFASKSNPCAASWKASTDNIKVGRRKYMRAMIKLADCAKANWEVVDYLRIAEPMQHEVEWLQEKEVDLL